MLKKLILTSVLLVVAILTSMKATAGRIADEQPKGETPQLKQEMILRSQTVIIFSLTPDNGEPPHVVVVIRGAEARKLKAQCNCESATFKELNLTILLDCSELDV